MMVLDLIQSIGGVCAHRPAKHDRKMQFTVSQMLSKDAHGPMLPKLTINEARTNTRLFGRCSGAQRTKSHYTLAKMKCVSLD